jgi:nicotinamide-nucleotide amidase
MKLQLLLTGNELMAGQTVDSNSAMIAEQLAGIGIEVNRKVTISDNLSDLIEEMSSLSRNSDVVIVNGGLGPTVDDLTAQALAELTGNALENNALAMEHLQAWCTKRKIPLNDSNRKQALLPQNIDIIPNPVGSAVGFSIEHQQCLIICTPGVPSELRLMMEQTILNTLHQRHPECIKPSTLRFQTFGIGESNLQQLVNNEFKDWPKEVDLGFRAGMPLLEVKLTITDPQHLALQQQCYQDLKQHIGNYIVGEDSTNLAQAVISLLQDKHQKLTTAESCTGGLIASAITEIAGASTVFEAGFVTYSNEMKHQLIQVDSETLEQHGAVSKAVVEQMVLGAIERSHADFAIAVSGIAGPEGGSNEKPVGTVWIAWGSKQKVKTHLFQLNSGTRRKWFQQMVTAIGLDLLRRELLEINEEPLYFKRY